MDTEKKMEELLEKINDDIKNIGWTVMGVFGSGDGGFTYSVGMSSFNAPEIIIPNVEPETAAIMINMLGMRMKNGERFSVGKDIKDIASNGYAVRLGQNGVLCHCPYDYLWPCLP